MNPWRTVSFWGSLRQGDPNSQGAAFHAGHVNDVLRLNIPPSFPVLVASDTSGVWLVNEFGGPAIPLSTEWDFPHLNCMSPGFYSVQHVYAAGDALYETDTASPSPLFKWRQIPIQTAGGPPLNPGQIYRVIVVQARKKIVLVADGGVFWASIPPAGGSYSFRQAPFLPGLRYSGLAEGAQNKVVVAAWGSDLNAHFGIFIGDWGGPLGDLIFERATITGSINARRMLRTEIAACANDRNRLYAVCGGGGNLTPRLDGAGKFMTDAFGDILWNGDDLIYRVLASKDGGATWKVTSSDIQGSSDKLFGGANDVIGHTQFGYNLCVGVSPFDPNLVAVGVGAFALSGNGGQNWQLFNFDSPHLHTDVHGLVFDPTDADRRRLYICSDGGLALTPDLGQTFATGANRQLPNFQFTRFSASAENSSLIGVSTQDNGNVYTLLYVNVEPWTDLDGGDGELMMYLQSGHLVRRNNTISETVSGTVIEYGNKTRIAEWGDGKHAFQDLKLLPTSPLSRGVIPVDNTGDGLAFSINEVVDAPVFANSAGRLMFAVAVKDETLYGLFGDGKRSFAWNQLALVPHDPSKDANGNELPYFATSVASRDGNSILVGMNNGKIFQLDAPAWKVSDLTIAGNGDAVIRLLVAADSVRFAMTGDKLFLHNGTKWVDVTPTTPAPTSSLAAIAANVSSSKRQIFLASSSQIWLSETDGATWSENTVGLPRAPQILDLRCNTESSGVSFLYASTFGWSVYRRLLNYDEVLKPVTISGHMDIVDRVVFGHDKWAHPVFFNVLNLGPLHPFEEADYTEDDGDEVRVVLKLRFEWRTDFSIIVKYDAILLAVDEDNFEDDRQSGSFLVPFNTTKQQVVDLSSDEFWPDRAHIEVNITN